MVECSFLWTEWLWVRVQLQLLEHQYLFDIAGTRLIKESGSLNGSSRAFIRYECNESKPPNPSPFIESIHFHFAIFSNTNQLISKLNKVPKVFCLQLQTYCNNQCFHHILSRLLTPYNYLSHLFPRLEGKPFYVNNLTLVPRLQSFYQIFPSLVTPYHTLSLLTIRFETKPFYWQL